MADRVELDAYRLCHHAGMKQQAEPV